VANRVAPSIRWALRHSADSNAALARRFELDPKTVAKWRSRPDYEEQRPGPKSGRSMPSEVEMLGIAARTMLQLPLDDCLALLHRENPRLTRSSLYRSFKRHRVDGKLNLLSSSDSIYRRKAVKSIGSLLGNIIDIEVDGRQKAVLVLTDIVSRWTFTHVLRRLDADNIIEGFERCFASFGHRVHWLFADTGSRMRLYRPTGFAEGPNPEEYLMKRYGVRTAPAHSRANWSELGIAKALGAVLSSSTGDSADFAQKLDRYVRFFNEEVCLQVLGGSTPARFLRDHSVKVPRFPVLRRAYLGVEIDNGLNLSERTEN
jgi:hypothetical protein